MHYKILLCLLALVLVACTTTPDQPEEQTPQPLPAEELARHQGKSLPKKVAPGTVDDYYWQVRERLIDSQRQKYPAKSADYYQWFYKNNFDKSNRRWTSQSILLFPQNGGKVMQLAFESYECGIGISLQDQALAKENFNTLLKHETNEFLGQEVLMSDDDFKSLGPKWSSSVTTEIKRPLVDVKKLRLKRGKYKCDGQGGHGYRLDIFLN